MPARSRPGQNTDAGVASARRIVKPGQIFDRLRDVADMNAVEYLSGLDDAAGAATCDLRQRVLARPIDAGKPQNSDRDATARSRERLAAEQAWQELGARRGIAVAVLRLAGIYGPGQNTLMQVASGRARRIVKPGQIFNRIHVGDIAQAIDAALARRVSGIFNVTDDEPTPPGDPIAFAAQLLGVPPPPELPFEVAAQTMSPMALSFWQECRRVRNNKLKNELGVSLLYPTYREGLSALFAEK